MQVKPVVLKLRKFNQKGNNLSDISQPNKTESCIQTLGSKLPGQCFFHDTAAFSKNNHFILKKTRFLGCQIKFSKMTLVTA